MDKRKPNCRYIEGFGDLDNNKSWTVEIKKRLSIYKNRYLRRLRQNGSRQTINYRQPW